MKKFLIAFVILGVLFLGGCNTKEYGSCDGELIVDNGLHWFEDYGEPYGWVYKGLSEGNSFQVTKDCEWCNSKKIMICGELNWTDKPRCTDILYEFYFPCGEDKIYAHREGAYKWIVKIDIVDKNENLNFGG